ncbi:ABC transporter ATP-binding protein [Pseudomonas rhizoryzae]|uniref:ABC transporter ATP-binding protein n=1 Tax=Pseudomonas rhizoryzae TaxID=2571129 RepID=UPI00073658B2|nr:ABC transporter ATP-binding protein [Pseudomonas rhizoryzae]KTT22787.1 ABC transporter [Pseudomonas psychrotolerans]KTT32907.1 ABC transporter [Pseudomonas psychrotolerans]KTT38017.1 ABC transporter [Pseudomonas psychrotolerans]KTT60229.1 ABC transporter [Pseudomonas psychrotolerans]KTT74021.1 ABC transporter [Pseudomonas psychrotolerans]
MGASLAKATSAAPVLLEVSDLTLAFGGVTAFTGVSFQVREGEICALIGPNGAGKSSLLNVINGLYRPQQGRVLLAGSAKALRRPQAAAHAGVARTFQNLALFKGMSVLDNVLTGRGRHRRASWPEQVFALGRAPAEERAQRAVAEWALDFLHLGPWRETPVGSLPYGLQKRVELARALAAEPRLLLLDEPMAGMNAGEKQELSGYIQAINREQGVTVVLIEHDIQVVMQLADHVVVLDYGRLIAHGPPAAVRQDPAVIAAYLGTRH